MMTDACWRKLQSFWRDHHLSAERRRCTINLSEFCWSSEILTALCSVRTHAGTVCALWSYILRRWVIRIRELFELEWFRNSKYVEDCCEQFAQFCFLMSLKCSNEGVPDVRDNNFSTSSSNTHFTPLTSHLFFRYQLFLYFFETISHTDFQFYLWNDSTISFPSLTSIKNVRYSDKNELVESK